MKRDELKLIHELLEKSENELYLELSIVSSSNSFEYSLNDLNKAIAKGKEVVSKQINIIKESICSNDYITKLAESKSYEDKVILVSAIADLIAATVIGISPITVAALLVKQGVPSLCNKT